MHPGGKITQGFLREFNAERPHETPDMKCPAELYVASTRPYAGLPEPRRS